MKRYILLISLLLFCLWEYVGGLSDTHILIVPLPSEIIHALVLHSKLLFSHAKVTCIEMAGSVAIACFLAFPIVWGMVRYKNVHVAVQSFFIFFQSFPAFFLAPLIVMWLGWGYQTVIIPSTLAMLFPLAMSLYKGLQAPPKEYVDYFRVCGATPSALFLKLQLPWALPYFFSGVRIALTMSGFGAVAGEWIGADKGLGILILQSRDALDIPLAYAALCTLALLTTSFYLLGVFIEKQQFRLSFFKGVMLLLVCLLAFPSCEKSEKKETSLMLDWTPNVNHVPLFVGKEKGFFEKEGIKLSIIFARNIEPLQALSCDKVDLILSYFPRALKASHKGVDVQVVGKLIDKPLNSIITLMPSKNLERKTIGIAGKVPSVSFLDAMFYGKNNTFEKRNVDFGLSLALVSKQVDAIYGAFFTIEGEEIREMGYEPYIMPVTDFGVPTYAELVVCAKKECSEELKARFLRALQRSIDYAKEHQEEAFEIYVKANPGKGERALIWERRAWEKTVPLLASSQSFSSEEISTFLSWAYAHNYLQKQSSGRGS